MTHSMALRIVGRFAAGINGPIFSFDHPRIHGGQHPELIFEEMGLHPKFSHFWLPTNSPDIHKVIEHTHARLVQTFQTWLFRDSSTYSLQEYKKALEMIFYSHSVDFSSVASWQVIKADVDSLHATLREVAGLKGGWPEKKIR